MARDSDLLDALSGLQPESFNGKVFRATSRGLDPTTPGYGGGRWMPADTMAVLYTSCYREGAMAELAYHLSMQTPLPSKAMLIHALEVETLRTVRLAQRFLFQLGVDEHTLVSLEYGRTQEIGDACAFLGYDGMLVPSARYECENLVLLCDNHDLSLRLEAVEAEDFDWLAWARERGLT